MRSLPRSVPMALMAALFVLPVGCGPDPRTGPTSMGDNSPLKPPTNAASKPGGNMPSAAGAAMPTVGTPGKK